MISSISYRKRNGKGGGVNRAPQRIPNKGSSTTFFIHGYNNDYDSALGSYERFLERLGITETSPDNIVEVFWPGDNWEGPLFYMQAVGQALQVAPLFARDIITAAKTQGYIRINFVSHSLGNRLALETVKEILNQTSSSNVLM